MCNKKEITMCNKKEITIDGEIYVLVPKDEYVENTITKSKLLDEKLSNVKLSFQPNISSIVNNEYVNAVNLWKTAPIDNILHVRTENLYTNQYTWTRKYGGSIDARSEDEELLERWYQLNKNKVNLSEYFYTKEFITWVTNRYTKDILVLEYKDKQKNEYFCIDELESIYIDLNNLNSRNPNVE